MNNEMKMANCANFPLNHRDDTSRVLVRRTPHDSLSGPFQANTNSRLFIFFALHQKYDVGESLVAIVLQSFDQPFV